jgi:hypothetical protein
MLVSNINIMHSWIDVGCPLWWADMSCHLQLQLALASAAILRSESHSTYEHTSILLSQIQDSPNLEGQVPLFLSFRNKVSPGTEFPFHHLPLTGLWYTYSNQPPPGVLSTILTTQNWLLTYPYCRLHRKHSFQQFPCYMQPCCCGIKAWITLKTWGHLFLPKCSLAMNVYNGSTIRALSKYATMLCFVKIV